MNKHKLARSQKIRILSFGCGIQGRNEGSVWYGMKLLNSPSHCDDCNEEKSYYPCSQLQSRWIDEYSTSDYSTISDIPWITKM